jgi:hypothetical protein
MIVSVHVPKCAGTSFRNILDTIFGDRIWHNYGAIFTRGQAVADVIPVGTRAIHGHFIADAFDDLLPKRRLITWVRDPVERVVSNYHHCLRSPDMRDDCCRLVHEQKLGLLEFADLDWMKNLSTRYLAGKPVADFAFVGIAEHFEESMEAFSGNLGFRRVLGVPRLNVNPKRREPAYTLSREERSFIVERNGADLAWYEQACQRLDAEEGLRTNRVA